MPAVRIPTPLRRLTGGQVEVRVEGSDLRAVIAGLDAAHPGLRERLVDDDGRLHPFVHVFVGSDDVRFRGGLDTPVAASDTVSIVPAVAGGAGGGDARPSGRWPDGRGNTRTVACATWRHW